MPIFPDPDALQWIAGAAAAGGVLFFALTLNEEMGWLALSSEPDPEPPPVTLPDDREASASLAGKLLKETLRGAAIAATAMAMASIQLSKESQWFFAFAIGTLPVLGALRHFAMIDVAGPAVGEPPPDEGDDDWHLDNFLDDYLSQPFWRAAAGVVVALVMMLMML